MGQIEAVKMKWCISGVMCDCEVPGFFTLKQLLLVSTHPQGQYSVQNRRQRRCQTVTQYVKTGDLAQGSGCGTLHTKPS